MTGWIDEGLNERAYIVPGLGDFGERRYVKLGMGYKDRRTKSLTPHTGIAHEMRQFHVITPVVFRGPSKYTQF